MTVSNLRINLELSICIFLINFKEKKIAPVFLNMAIKILFYCKIHNYRPFIINFC